MLGTGGTYPLTTRALASVFIRVAGVGILIDCGEATQIEMQKYGVGFTSIDYILITNNKVYVFTLIFRVGFTAYRFRFNIIINPLLKSSIKTYQQDLLFYTDNL